MPNEHSRAAKGGLTNKGKKRPDTPERGRSVMAKGHRDSWSPRERDERERQRGKGKKYGHHFKLDGEVAFPLIREFREGRMSEVALKRALQAHAGMDPGVPPQNIVIGQDPDWPMELVVYDDRDPMPEKEKRVWPVHIVKD